MPKGTNWPRICEEAPNSFLNSANMILFYQNPPPDASCDHVLSLEIWDQFLNNRLDEQSYINKIKAWQDLNTYFRTKAGRNIEPSGLMIAGSTINGFGLKDSDIDVTILQVKGKEHKFDDTNKRSARHRHLTQHFLGFLGHYRGFTKLEFIKEWIPIIRFYDKVYKEKFDVAHNQLVWMKNSHLLFHYSQVDWRVKPLVTIVKLWAKKVTRTFESFKLLNSFNLTLMVIYFLQAGVSPAILPSLQKLFPQQLGIDMNPENMDFRKLEIPPPEKVNNQELGELIVQFFKFYSNFDFKNRIISVRLGTIVSADDYRCPRKSLVIRKSYGEKHPLLVEEPYEIMNAALKVKPEKRAQTILAEFSKAYGTLNRSQRLQSII